MSAPQSIPPPPEIIAGRYRIEAKLGQGGMGSVWRAQHLTLRSPVAIKLIDPSLASSEEALARFLREAQAAASLRRPHVVQILDHGVDNGVPYIAMELLEGESLADRLDRTTKLSPAETARIMTHTARAMSRAHEAGIVHRDLKPDNIFIVRNEDDEIAKVLDFGIAKAKSSAFEVTTGTRTGAMMGTPYYMSPEQVEGSKNIDHRTDLWAMAVIAYECVTGVRPFDGETLGALLLQICARALPIPSLIADVPAGFDAWFLRATQRVPDERFQSAREMADALRVVLAPTGISQAMLATPPTGTLGTSREAVAREVIAREGVARDAGADANRSGVVLRSVAVEAEVSGGPSLYPAGVRRRSRMLPLLIAGGLLALLAVASLLFTGPRDDAPAHVVKPAGAAPAAAELAKPLPAPVAPAPAVLAPVVPAPVAVTAPRVIEPAPKVERAHRASAAPVAAAAKAAAVPLAKPTAPRKPATAAPRKSAASPSSRDLGF